MGNKTYPSLEQERILLIARFKKILNVNFGRTNRLFALELELEKKVQA